MEHIGRVAPEVDQDVRGENDAAMVVDILGLNPEVIIGYHQINGEYIQVLAVCVCVLRGAG